MLICSKLQFEGLMSMLEALAHKMAAHLGECRIVGAALPGRQHQPS